MRHDKAPIRLYKRPDGKLIVWEEGDESILGTGPSTREMDQPDPQWTLVRGFGSKKSFTDYVRNSPANRSTISKSLKARRYLVLRIRKCIAICSGIPPCMAGTSYLESFGITSATMPLIAESMKITSLAPKTENSLG